MELLDNLGLGFATALSPWNLLYAFIGCLLGTAVGVLPGLGPLATIAMLLPLTFSLPPVLALIMLSGIYYGAQYGGSTTAILINLPGESSSVVTAIDGYQMAKNGRAGQALATAALGSFFAGSVATVILALFAPPLAEVALEFGPAEYFSLMVLGLVASVALASGSLLKAFTKGQQVLTWHGHPELAPELFVEPDEVAVQLLAPLRVEFARDGLRRTVAGREEAPDRLAVGLAQHGRAGLEFEVEGRPEQLSDPFRPTPFEGRRRCWRGRRGHVGTHDLEHLRQRPFGGPGGQADAPTTSAHARDLGGGCLGVAREHHAAGGDHHVEAFIVEPQLLGVADLELDVEVGLSCPFLGRLDQVRADVDADHLGAPRGRQAGRPAGAGGEVKHPLARARPEPMHAVLDKVGDGAADRVVLGTAGAPRRRGPLVVRLDRGSHAVPTFSHRPAPPHLVRLSPIPAGEGKAKALAIPLSA